MGSPASSRSVGIVGYGRFGQALALLLLDAGVEVKCHDPKGHVPPELAAPTLSDVTRGTELIILAVHFDALDDVAREISNHLDPVRHVVLDVTAAKARSAVVLGARLGTKFPWVTTHPLFGAVSIASSERPLPVIVCPNDVHPDATATVIAFFKEIGCEVMTRTAEEHDMLIARTQCIAFFIAKALSDAALTFDARLIPPSMRGFARMLELLRGEEAHALRSMTAEIPESAVARGALIEQMNRIDRDLARGGRGDSDAASPTPPMQEDLGARSPLLREARDAIDAIDRNMVELLAQRSRLSVRARTAKQVLGHPVFDPSREAQLLGSRRLWAVEHDLDPDAVDAVFAAILLLSRRIQEA